MTLTNNIKSGISNREDYARILTAAQDQIVAIARTVIGTLEGGGKIMTCGNGGSAAESLHFAEELIGRFRANRRSLPAVALVADATALTCIGNDFGFDEIFARQVDGLGRAGDLLVVLSTSGKSPNIIRALEQARSVGIQTTGLLGEPGSPAETLCDVAFTPATDRSDLVQELHLAVIHLVLSAVDELQW